MATALICDMCETEQADVIVTNLGNGDTMAVGSNCLPALGQQFMAMGPEPEGLAPIQEGDGSWPGDVDLSNMPGFPGVDMAKLMAEAQAEAEAEAAAGLLPSEPQEGQESPGEAGGTETPTEAPEAASGASEPSETTV